MSARTKRFFKNRGKRKQKINPRWTRKWEKGNEMFWL